MQNTKALKHFFNGVLAGILISLGGAVYLAADNKVVGAVFFSLALVCICYQGYALYTGKICYLCRNISRENISLIFMCLLGNAMGTILMGWAIRLALPTIGTAAYNLCYTKLTSQTLIQTGLRAVFCGIMVYLSVDVFKNNNKNPLAILLCIPAFILSGYEHSIADLFYFGASGILSIKATGYLFLVILGNSLGGLICPLLQDLCTYIDESAVTADEEQSEDNIENSAESNKSETSEN